jgi:predicted alpha/beta hydrolase
MLVYIIVGVTQLCKLTCIWQIIQYFIINLSVSLDFNSTLYSQYHYWKILEVTKESITWLYNEVVFSVVPWLNLSMKWLYFVGEKVKMICVREWVKFEKKGNFKFDSSLKYWYKSKLYEVLIF